MLCSPDSVFLDGMLPIPTTYRAAHNITGVAYDIEVIPLYIADITAPFEYDLIIRDLANPYNATLWQRCRQCAMETKGRRDICHLYYYHFGGSVTEDFE